MVNITEDEREVVEFFRESGKRGDCRDNSHKWDMDPEEGW